MKQKFAKPLSPYSIQKQPWTPICPKFVPAIVFGGYSQGVKIFKKLSKFEEPYLQTNFDIFF